MTGFLRTFIIDQGFGMKQPMRKRSLSSISMHSSISNNENDRKDSTAGLKIGTNTAKGLSQALGGHLRFSTKSEVADTGTQACFSIIPIIVGHESQYQQQLKLNAKFLNRNNDISNVDNMLKINSFCDAKIIDSGSMDENDMLCTPDVEIVKQRDAARLAIEYQERTNTLSHFLTSAVDLDMSSLKITPIYKVDSSSMFKCAVRESRDTFMEMEEEGELMIQELERLQSQEKKSRQESSRSEHSVVEESESSD